jgi:hypothetical protein
MHINKKVGVVMVLLATFFFAEFAFVEAYSTRDQLGPADMPNPNAGEAPVASPLQAGSGLGNTAAPGTERPSSGSSGSSGAVSGSNIQCQIKDFKSVVTCFGSIINTVIPIIIALTVLFIVWNIFKLIKSGDGENLKGIKDIILWGVLGLFCMLSIWGFVAILSNTFDLNNTPIVPEPFKISN